MGLAGTSDNPLTCTAKITLTKNPMLRKSPYAVMLFNGAGRYKHANILPASMGSNKRPIVNESLLYSDMEDGLKNIKTYLLERKQTSKFNKIPDKLRRITTREAT